MARRKKSRRRRVVRVAVANPRRRRHRRRRNPVIAGMRFGAARRRVRHHRRRRNPSAMKVGQIFKDMVYGAAGAIATRVGSSIAASFIPGSFAGSPLAVPVTQAAVAVTLVRWGGKKFLGQQQGDLMMLGGLISAGLAAADAYFPNVQSQLTSIIRAPIQIAAPAPAAAALAGYRGYADVEEVPDSVFAGLGGFGDVEDVPSGIFA